MSAIIFDDESIIPDEVGEIEQKLKEVSKSKKPYQLLKILRTKQYEDLTDKFVWYLIVDTWVESELNHQQKDVWKELFALRKVPKHFTQDLQNKIMFLEVQSRKDKLDTIWRTRAMVCKKVWRQRRFLGNGNQKRRCPILH